MAAYSLASRYSNRMVTVKRTRVYSDWTVKISGSTWRQGIPSKYHSNTQEARQDSLFQKSLPPDGFRERIQILRRLRQIATS